MDPEVDRLARAQHLGSPRGGHDPGTEPPRARAWLVILAIPGLVVLPFTIVFVARGFGWLSVLGLLLTCGYLGAAGRVLVLHVLPYRGRGVHLYEHGLIVTGGDGPTAFAWDKVKELRASGVRKASRADVAWQFTLVRDDGREAALSVPDAGELVETISAAVTRRMLPKYVARVEGGGSVRIGPFTIGRDGVAKDTERVPWPSVAQVVIDNGMVSVVRSDQRAGLTATAGEVPNAVAFSGLVDHVREQELGRLPPGG